MVKFTHPRMRLFVPVVAMVVAAAGLASWAAAEDKAAKEDEKKPKPLARPMVIALRFHADWCGSCKKLDPQFKAVAKKLADQPILFLTLDLTNDKTKRQAHYLAAALGLGKQWDQLGGGKTGIIQVLDGFHRQPMAKFNYKYDAKKMGAELTKAVKKVKAHAKVHKHG